MATTKTKDARLVIPSLEIENARIGLLNFTGKKGKFNEEGNRNFCLMLDQDRAEALAAAGWNIKYLKPKEEGDEPQAFTQIKVSYAYRHPKIQLMNGRNKRLLTENQISLLDWAKIVKVDLIVRGSNWEKGGSTGVKGYLDSMYVTIEEDRFAAKYDEVPDSGRNLDDD